MNAITINCASETSNGATSYWANGYTVSVNGQEVGSAARKVEATALAYVVQRTLEAVGLDVKFDE